jgi:hypothetical protein
MTDVERDITERLDENAAQHPWCRLEDGELLLREVASTIRSLREERGHLREANGVLAEDFARAAEDCHALAREVERLRVALNNSECLARLFHETYERLAPSFGYETRRDSAVSWEDVPPQNRSLMVATAGEVGRALSDHSRSVAEPDAEQDEAGHIAARATLLALAQDVRPCERCGGCGCALDHSRDRSDMAIGHSGQCPACQGSGRSEKPREGE